MAKKASLEFSISVDSARVKSNLDQVRQAFAQATAGINTSLAGIKGFADLKRQSEETARAYAEAQRKVAELAKTMREGGGGKALERDFDQARTAAARLKETLAGQQVELQRLRGALSAGGVSSRDLAGAQQRLRAELDQSRAKYAQLAAAANARDVLGLPRHAEIRAEIQRTREAYSTLARSGNASLAELARAKVAMRQRIGELTEGTNNWRDALGQIKGRAVEAAAVFAALGMSAREAIRFESSMADVNKTVGGSRAEMAALSNELRDMSLEVPIDANELAKIAAAGGQLGVAAAEIPGFTEVVAKMSTAFDMSAEQSGDAIGKIKNVYQLTIPEVESLGDAINQLGNTSAARERDIIDVMMRIGGTSKQFGLAKEQTAALAASMLSLGKPAEVAGTSINAMLNRMQTATMQGGKFQEALAKIGMDAEQMAAQVAGNPQLALDTLLETLGQLEGKDRAEVLTGLFGAEFQDDIGVLVGSLQTYRDAMGQVADKTAYAGAMNKEFETRSATTANELQLLKNTVMDIVRSLGEGFLPLVNQASGMLNSLLQPVAGLVREFPRLTAAIVGLLGGAVVFGTVTKAFGIARAALLTFVETATTNFPKAGEAADKLSGRIDGVNKVVRTGSGLLAAFGVGWEIGTFLGKFDFIKKGALSVVHTLDLLWLSAKRMWAMLTGGDSGAVDRQITAAKQAYSELLAEIDAGTDEVAKKAEDKVAAPQEDAAAKEQAANDAIMAKQAEDVKKMAEEQQAARDAKVAAETEAKEKAEAERAEEEEARRQAEEERQLRTSTVAATPPRPEPVRVQPVATAVRATQAADQQADKKAEEDMAAADRARAEERAEAERAEKEEQAADRRAKADEAAAAAAVARDEQEAEAEDRRAKRDEARQVSADQARAAEEAAAAAEEQRQAEAAQAAEEQAARFEQLQAEQAQAAEERMAAEREATEEAKSIFERYAERVKSLQEEIGDREKSLAEDLAEMDPNADEATKWQRRAAEAKKYEKAAKAAMEAGNLDEAQEMADQARSLYKGLGSGAEGVDKDAAKRMAYSGVRSAGQLGLEIAQAMPTLAKKEAQVDLSKVDGLNNQLAALLTGKMGAMAAAPGAPSRSDGGKASQVHEIRLGGARLSGSPADVSEFIRQLEMAGMAA